MFISEKESLLDVPFTLDSVMSFGTQPTPVVGSHFIEAISDKIKVKHDYVLNVRDLTSTGLY